MKLIWNLFDYWLGFFLILTKVFVPTVGTPVFLVVLYLSIKLEMSQNTGADTSTSE